MDTEICMGTEICRYGAHHRSERVPAVTTIDCGAVAGVVPACQECADAYARKARGTGQSAASASDALAAMRDRERRSG
jgi:hypothetical protein